MPSSRSDCAHFGDRLLDPAGPTIADESFAAHLDGCPSCRAQWRTHQLLGAAFADTPAPDLSIGFETRLERKIAHTVEVRPLRGWRRAALLAYAAAAVALLAWSFRDVPLTIDLTTPWLPFAAFATIPLSLVLALAVSRLLPARLRPGQPSVPAF